jgi:hypothetical protein
MARLHILAGAFLVLGAMAAHAQGAPGAPPPPPGGPEPGMMHPPMGERGGYMGMHRPPMEMMQKAAGFRFKRDGAEIDIRCASSEPTKACVDAASVLIDKLATMKTNP